jgi:hypothetical protein
MRYLKISVPHATLHERALPVRQRDQPMFCMVMPARLLPVALLIRADELCVGQHVALHCSLDLRFRRAF